MQQLNLKGSGSRQRIADRIKSLQLDCSHWRYGLGKRQSYARPLTTVLVENSPHKNTWELKRRLLREGLLTDECSGCHSKPEWQGKPLTLQLDHINGVRKDNRLENLRVLCPNCHSQTDTYAGRNQTGKPQKKPEEYIRYACTVCGKLSRFSRTKICAECRTQRRLYPGCKLSLSQIQQLPELFSQGMSKRAIAKKLGVSDTLVRGLLRKATPTKS